MRWILVIGSSLALLSAGCAGADPNPRSTTTTTESAAPPTVGEETGAIQGTVVDEEQLPIGGVAIAVVQLNIQAETDAQGAFTFNGIAPGEFTVAAQRLGYESVARRVQVIAGEVTGVNFTLAPLDLAPEPYILAMPHTSYIQFGNAWGHYATFTGNSTGIHSIMCEACVWHFHFDRKPQVLMTEARWACSPCHPPVINNDAWFLVNQNESAIVVLNTYLSNGEKYMWTDGQIRVIGAAKDNKAQWRLNAGGGSTAGTGAEGISYNQRINLWQTFAYHQDLPDGYSAFPPE